MKPSPSETALSIFFKELFCEIIILFIFCYLIHPLMAIFFLFFHHLPSSLSYEIFIPILEETFKDFLTLHFLRILGIVAFATIIVRLPWQMIISFRLRLKYRHRNTGYFWQTIVPILSSYLICYTIFIPMMQYNKPTIEYVLEAWYMFFISIGFSSLSAALLTPYVRYRITGKRLKDYFPEKAE